MFHGNSYQNDKRHHLYAIFDREDESVYKYGISDDAVEADGLSERVREQVILFNRIAKWPRFFGVVLEREIAGRRKARAVERAFIRAFQVEFGRRPIGNLID